MNALTRKDFNTIQVAFTDVADESTFKKEISFALQILEKNDYLQKCDRNSILSSVLNVAQIGLSLNPARKEAYLVPRYVNKSLQCCLDPSYIGLQKLLTDSGSVTSIECQIIYEGDDVEINMADSRKVTKHVPYILTGKPKGQIIGVYSIAKLHDGSFHIEIMSKADIDEIKERSEAYKAYKAGKTKTTIWITDEGEMSRKTVVKRHFKFLPKSDKTDKLSQAIDLDNFANGFDEPVNYHSIDLIESLIDTSAFDQEMKAKLFNDASQVDTQNQANRMIKYLKDNQLPESHQPITSMKQVNSIVESKVNAENT